MKEEFIKEILSKYSTPLYVYDINEINERIKYLKSLLLSRISLCYAIKANTFLVKEIEESIDRYEVCSPGEYQICKEKGVDSKKILISGVYKEYEFISNLMRENPDIGYYTIESMEQFEMLKNLSQNYKFNVIIRLTSGNQFGINENEVEEIIKNKAEYSNMQIKGIQYFSGTQKGLTKKLEKEINYVDEYIEKLQSEYGFEVEELEFGPGFPVYYFESDKEFEEDNFINEFVQLIENMKFKGKVTLELGRSIAASCGKYITKVVDKKTNKNQNYAILDGGIHHLVYYGQSMAMKFPKLEVYPKRKMEGEEKWNLCGSLCTINDLIVKQLPIENLQINDVFIFKNTGAYCATEGISLFLSRNLPRVIKVNKEKIVEETRTDLSTYKINM